MDVVLWLLWRHALIGYGYTLLIPSILLNHRHNEKMCASDDHKSTSLIPGSSQTKSMPNSLWIQAGGLQPTGIRTNTARGLQVTQHRPFSSLTTDSSKHQEVPSVWLSPVVTCSMWCTVNHIYYQSLALHVHLSAYINHIRLIILVQLVGWKILDIQFFWTLRNPSSEYHLKGKILPRWAQQSLTNKWTWR